MSPNPLRLSRCHVSINVSTHWDVKKVRNLCLWSMRARGRCPVRENMGWPLVQQLKPELCQPPQKGYVEHALLLKHHLPTQILLRPCPLSQCFFHWTVKFLLSKKPCYRAHKNPHQWLGFTAQPRHIPTRNLEQVSNVTSGCHRLRICEMGRIKELTFQAVVMRIQWDAAGKEFSAVLDPQWALSKQSLQSHNSNNCHLFNWAFVVHFENVC